uniref:Uncharacterized LOC100179682 n=1 Tax=Ciona intestinalis TaxID=7719 RepID=H2Y2E9_CIOIN|nr:uncharacterized protein LOC100179682 [Ciona intestinalis]|eukprot:XP_002125969.1 uncharacterized protein LOC100179682 [Ciona intestinalis]
MLLAGRLRSAVKLTKAASNVYNATKPLVPKTASRVFKRHGGTNRMGYRCMPPDDPLIEMACDVVLTVLWAYLYYNFYHSGGTLFNVGVNYHTYEHLSDADLGI